MIAGIEGVLESIEEGVALVRVQGPDGSALTYEILLPAYTAARLDGSIGQPVGLVTMYFIESQAQGATMTPRLAGFLSRQDRRFFELFTTCKGIGNRRALRAMTVDVGRLAGAIADRDVALLQTLPEIGRRTAETIVVTLRGKVDRFVSLEAGDSRGGAADLGEPGDGSQGGKAREALGVLLELGENRAQAQVWIDQALRDQDGGEGDVQQIVAEVYRIKAQR